jgi:hypothetical protein
LITISLNSSMRGSIALLLAGLLTATACSAGTVSGAFNVSVDLKPHPTGICINTSESNQTNAWVRVTCQGGQFVSIEPRDGGAFVGTHGGAYRYAFSAISAVPAGLLGTRTLDDWIGQGTITALRVLNLTERDERLELLVSF